MADAVRTKELSPREIVKTVLERIDTLNPKLNTFYTITRETAIEEAKRAEQVVAKGEPFGALHGVPVSFKVSMITKDVQTTLGSRIFENSVPKEDAPLVERLKGAGVIILGKTTMPEFSWKGMTGSPLHGIARNPWNPDYTLGGSSGDASAQVAAGMVRWRWGRTAAARYGFRPPSPTCMASSRRSVACPSTRRAPSMRCPMPARSPERSRMRP